MGSHAQKRSAGSNDNGKRASSAAVGANSAFETALDKGYNYATDNVVSGASGLLGELVKEGSGLRTGLGYVNTVFSGFSLAGGGLGLLDTAEKWDQLEDGEGALGLLENGLAAGSGFAGLMGSYGGLVSATATTCSLAMMASAGSLLGAGAAGVTAGRMADSAFEHAGLEGLDGDAMSYSDVLSESALRAQHGTEDFIYGLSSDLLGKDTATSVSEAAGTGVGLLTTLAGSVLPHVGAAAAGGAALGTHIDEAHKAEGKRAPDGSVMTASDDSAWTGLRWQHDTSSAVYDGLSGVVGSDAASTVGDVVGTGVGLAATGASALKNGIAGGAKAIGSLFD